jgi:hypothetical protein
VPEFNGNKELPEDEQLKATISVMRLSDLLDLGDTFKQADFEEGDMKNMSLDQMKVLVKGAGQYVPKYVTLSGNDGFDARRCGAIPQFLSSRDRVALHPALLFPAHDGRRKKLVKAASHVASPHFDRLVAGLNTSQRTCSYYLAWFGRCYRKGDAGWFNYQTPDGEPVAVQDAFSGARWK